MNCLPTLPIRVSNVACLLAICWLAACTAPAEESRGGPAAANGLEYDSAYRVSLDAGAGLAFVTLDVSQPRHLLREMRFELPHSAAIDGDGPISRDDSQISWIVPEGGGTLSWSVPIANERTDGVFDAWLGPDWGIFRAEDIIPRARTRTLKGAFSNTTLDFDLPDEWSVVTEYPSRDGRLLVERDGRRFDQPAGWIVTGDLGVRRERIAGVSVVVAAPVGQRVRRMDMLAMMNWVLPEMARLLPALPARITVVSAGEPMWRGGLSAPQSLFIHADRPLISENGTSTLVHELLHLSLNLSAAEGHDWIIEGLAEFYTLELLKRSGTITSRRYERAMVALEEWGRESDALCGANSTGATTARAVALFHALDLELRQRHADRPGLDDVVFRLVEDGQEVDLRVLTDTVLNLFGGIPELIDSERLPGCRTLATARH